MARASDFVRKCRQERIITKGAGDAGLEEKRLRLLALIEKLHRADRWFAEHDPDHPLWVEAGQRIDLVVAELGKVLEQLWEMGFEWDGAQLVQLGEVTTNADLHVA